MPVQAVAASGTTAYLGSGSTFVVLDISNPTSPAVLGSLRFVEGISAVAVSGGFAFVADGAGVHVVSVTDPSHPVEVATIAGMALDAALSGTRLYVAGDNLRIYDASNPAVPVRLGSWRGDFFGETLVRVAGEYAYVIGTPDLEVEAMTVVRVADPANPVPLGGFGWSGLDQPFPTRLAVAGPLVLVSESSQGGVGGLLVIDASNPSAPVRLGGYERFGLDGRAIATSGAFAFLGDSAQLITLDIADPRNPTFVSYQSLAAAPNAVEVSGSTVLVADHEAGLYLFDASACGASGCSLSCTPVVPASGVAGNVVAYQGGYLSSGCAGTPAFDWDFGDGSPHSSEQSPSHTYAAGGSFHWSFNVSLGGASCSTGGTISVASTLPPITDPGTYAYLVPTSAHKDGFNDTHWVTDLVLTNPGLADATARLYFIKGGRDNTGSPARPVFVPLRRSLKLVDVLATTFSETGASGAILVGSDVPLIVTSRTYNMTSTGTYGQFVEGVPLAEAFGPGQTAWLPGLSQSTSGGVGYRTNVGVANAGGQHVQVEIALYGSDGVWLGSRTVILNPYDFQQVDKVFAGIVPLGVDNGYALVSTSTAGAALFAYASVVDNATGDPIAVPANVQVGGP